MTYFVENNVHSNVRIKVLTESDVGQILTHEEDIKRDLNFSRDFCHKCKNYFW
jgi:hypothetical protein